MRNFVLIPVLACLLCILQSCDKENDGDNHAVYECGDSLMTNPVYIFHQAHYKFNDEQVTANSGSGGTWALGTNEDSTVTIYQTMAAWGLRLNDSTYHTLSVDFGRRINFGQILSLTEIYDVLRPGTRAYRDLTKLYEDLPAEFVRVYATHGNPFYDSFFSAKNNETSTFEITGRSPIKYDDNGYPYTDIEGVFCCKVYSRYDTLFKTSCLVQGNFNGKVILKQP